MTDDERAVVVVEKGGSVGTFLFGLLVGAGAALLLAPRTGEETRALLSDRARRLKDVAGESLDELQDTVEDGFERAKAGVEQRLERARRTLDEKKEGAKAAMRAGRSAVRSAREELERRLAESRGATEGGDDTV